MYYAFSDVLLERSERELKTRIAINLLNMLNDNDTESISYIARVTELSEDVVREIAFIVAKEKESKTVHPADS